MGIPRLIRLEKHKQFHYIPRYYDPQKEELKERIKRIEEEEGINRNNGEYQPGIKKGQMRNYYIRNKSEKSFSSIRLIILMAALSLIAYYLFFK